MNQSNIKKKLTQLFTTLTIGSYSIELPTWFGALHKEVGIRDRIAEILEWFVGFSVVLSLGFIIYSGIQFMTSAGDAEKVASARKMLTAAVVGMVIVLLSRVIIMFFINTFFE